MSIGDIYGKSSVAESLVLLTLCSCNTEAVHLWVLFWDECLLCSLKFSLESGVVLANEANACDNCCTVGLCWDENITPSCHKRQGKGRK